MTGFECLEEHLAQNSAHIFCSQDDDFEAAEKKALKCGAEKLVVEDLRREFVEGRRHRLATRVVLLTIA